MIAPNDVNIIYSPYNWDVTAERAKTITAGAYFRVLIGGDPASVELAFDLSGVAAPLPHIRYTIDGVSTRVPVAATVPVPLPSSNTWGKHLLEVVVEATSETVNRWTTQANAVKLAGITTSGTAATQQRKARRALILGDSITEGVRTLNMDASTDVERNSASLCWSSMVAAAAGAEVGVVGFGSTGVVKASGSGGVPSLINHWNTLWSAGPTRSVTSNPPDWIIINQGTNDGATDVTAAYTAVLNDMLAATPAVTLIFCMETFAGGHGAEIQAAIASSTAPARCVYVDTTGWWSSADASDGLHPYGYTAPSLSARVSDAVIAATTTAPVTTAVGHIFDVNGIAQPIEVG